MAGGLMVVFVIIPMVFGLLFLVCIWTLRVRSSRAPSPDRREGLLWIAVISFTLGVGIDFYFMLGHISWELRKLLPPVSFSLACIGIALSLLGKEKEGLSRQLLVVGSQYRGYRLFCRNRGWL